MKNEPKNLGISGKKWLENENFTTNSILRNKKNKTYPYCHIHFLIVIS